MLIHEKSKLENSILKLNNNIENKNKIIKNLQLYQSENKIKKSELENQLKNKDGK